MTIKPLENSGGRTRIIELLQKRAKTLAPVATNEPEDRYAALLSRCCTSTARDLTFALYKEIAHYEKETKKRVRRRLARTGVVFVDAIERFVGDLLRAKADNSASGLIPCDGQELLR
jgi:hypothetical protein